MLYIKTVVKPSSINGLGLFAAEPIKKDTLIFKWDELFGWNIHETDFVNLAQNAKEFLYKYGWRNKRFWYLDLDDSRFINHSYQPNMIVSKENIITSTAARDIAVDEELTEDYSAFDPDFDKYKEYLK